MRRKLRRRSGRRARDGAALVQALIVGLTMAVTLACVMMFARAYSAKILAGQLSRSEAWTLGTQGCPDGVIDPGQASDGLIGQDPEQNGLAQQIMQAAFRLSPAQAAPGDSTANAPLLLGGEAIGFQTVTQFSCNEVPDTSGDMISVGESLLRQASNMFGW